MALVSVDPEKRTELIKGVFLVDRLPGEGFEIRSKWDLASFQEPTYPDVVFDNHPHPVIQPSDGFILIRRIKPPHRNHAPPVFLVQPLDPLPALAAEPR